MVVTPFEDCTSALPQDHKLQYTHAIDEKTWTILFFMIYSVQVIREKFNERINQLYQ